MSSIAPTSNTASGLPTQQGVTPNGTNAEGLSDMFMQLLVAQVSHQNPLDPMDGTQYVSQLAEFANVESLQSIRQSSEKSLSLQSSQQLLEATQLVGQQVNVPTDKIALEQAQPIQGAVNLSSPAEELRVRLYDAEGDLVDEKTITPQGPATIDFTFDEQAPGYYTIQAEALTQNRVTAKLTPLMRGSVERVSVGRSENDIQLQVNGLGNFNLLETNQLHSQNNS